MADWFEKCLVGVPTDQIFPLLNEFGFANPYKLQEWLFSKAALCRLAFASIIESDGKPVSFSVPDESIISRTEFGMGKGRPKTAQSGFWLAYIIRQELKGFEKNVTSAFLSRLVGILLNSKVEPEKMRSVLGDQRKEAEKRATEAAKFILENNLMEDWTEKKFRRYTKGYLEETLSPDAYWPPVIENGKVSQEWLENLLSIRKAILRKTKKSGPLGGQAPRVDMASHTRVSIELPLTPPPFYNSPKRDGLIHFGKGVNVPVPMSLFEQEKRNGGDIGFSLTCNKEGGSTSVRFPAQLLNKREPFMAALYAVPAWWFEWENIYECNRE